MKSLTSLSMDYSLPVDSVTMPPADEFINPTDAKGPSYVCQMTPQRVTMFLLGSFG
jgi:hypothetical protein